MAELPGWAVKPEEQKLPGTYGKTRAVLLVVGPNLVHAYWEVLPATLRRAKRKLGGPGQPVLRFHEVGGSFDVDVNLGFRNWFVPLWSAGKSYHAVLGLRGGDGGFVQLARSNVVHTPRALPVAEVGERFMRVAAPRRRAPSAEAPPSPSASPQAAASAPEPVDSTEVLGRKLAEFHALRESRPEPSKSEEAPFRAPGGPSREERYSDLTELAENQQTMGRSSALLPGGGGKA